MEVFRHLLPLIAALMWAAVVAHAIFRGMTFAVDETCVRVRIYGLTLRKVALADVAWASHDWTCWGEHWTDTFRPSQLILLRLRTGWFKNFVISPPSPPEFLRQLAAHGVTVR